MSTPNHNILYFVHIPGICLLNTAICLWKAPITLVRRGLSPQTLPQTLCNPAFSAYPPSIPSLAPPAPAIKAQFQCIFTPQLCELWTSSPNSAPIPTATNPNSCHRPANSLTCYRRASGANSLHLSAPTRLRLCLGGVRRGRFAGCPRACPDSGPTLAASLFLPLGWDTTIPSRAPPVRGPRGQVLVRGVEIPRFWGPGRPQPQPTLLHPPKNPGAPSMPQSFRGMGGIPRTQAGCRVPGAPGPSHLGTWESTTPTHPSPSTQKSGCPIHAAVFSRHGWDTTNPSHPRSGPPANRSWFVGWRSRLWDLEYHFAQTRRVAGAPGPSLLGTGGGGWPRSQGNLIQVEGAPGPSLLGTGGARRIGPAIAHPLGQLPASLAGCPLRFDLHGSAHAGFIVAEA
jgi:hypothetical protein